MPPPACTLDAGALIAAEADDVRVRAVLAERIRTGAPTVVPAPVVVQAWRGGRRSARMARLLRACDVEPLDEDLARQAGELLGRTLLHDAVDAVVAASAARRGGVLYTSDPDDLLALLAATGGHPVRVVRL